MLESTIDDIIDDHWTYQDQGVHIKTDGMGIIGNAELRSYDLVLDNNENLYVTPQPPQHQPVLATVTYDDKPVIDVKRDVQARIQYHANTTYQRGLLRPSELTVDGGQATLLSSDQVKNAIAGLRPEQTEELFINGLTTAHLSRPDGTLREKTYQVDATYRGLNGSPDKENYNAIIQGITRPHGEYPLNQP